MDQRYREIGWIQAVLFESIMHATFGASATCLAKHAAEALIDRLRPIAGGSWNWNGTRFLARDGVLAMANNNGDEVDVYLAATTPLGKADPDPCASGSATSRKAAWVNRPTHPHLANAPRGHRRSQVAMGAYGI